MFLWPAIKSFLIFLNRLPEFPTTNIIQLEYDEYCLEELKSL